MQISESFSCFDITGSLTQDLNRQLKRDSVLEPDDDLSLEDMVDYYLGAVEVPFCVEDFFISIIDYTPSQNYRRKISSLR